MRDLIILLVVVLTAAYALYKPWTGAAAGVLISLMSPHVEFGYSAANWPVAQVVAIGTLLGLLFTKDRQNPVLGAPVGWFLAFWLWICITLPFSIYFDDSLSLWIRSIKIFVLVLVALVLINDRFKLDALIASIVLALGFYGVKGGLFTLASGGNHRVWGPGGFVEGNNELAVALIALLPLVRYMHLQAANVWLRRALLGVMLLLPATILGSHSRGALLGLAAMALVLWTKTRKKVLWAAIAIGTSPALLSLMPEHWWSRMETIQTYDADDSALGRINAWWMAWNLARSNPFGGGFSIYTREVFARYAPDPDRVHAAHSIYFQVLGEHGFIGLILFLGIGASTLWACAGLQRMARQDARLKWAGDLGAMLQVSIVGFAAGGAFLSLAYFDFLYYQMAIVAIARVVAHRQRQALSIADKSATSVQASQSEEPRAIQLRNRQALSNEVPRPS